MIVMYTSEGCASCRKARQYMKDNQLKYIEKNIMKDPLQENEIRYLLKRSENGTDDIISSRSKLIKDDKIDISDMSVNELISFVIKNPTVLKRPIIIDKKNFITGYDPDEITVFKRNNELSLES
ncbi:MAG: transcriptional regulator Spx [Erysipelotrichaceae bacterium]|nr:transcriptional regulator Spx [Erysipelotrichaceae bacterium]